MKTTTESKIVKWLCVLLLLVQQLAPALHATEVSQIQLAQSSPATNVNLDLDPPEVTHIAITQGTASEVQTFTVNAFDNQGIESVTMMIKSNLQDDYRPVTMQSVPGSQDYIASTETTTEQKFLEYYFLVIDVGGNKVLSGFPFEPYKRTLATQPATDIEKPATAAQPVRTDTTTGDTNQDDSTHVNSATKPTVDQSITTNEPAKSNLLIWGAVGLLILGALASSTSGSSGSSGDDNGGGATVPVTLTAPLPR